MCHSMMQESNENIKEIIGIISILDYLILSSNPCYTTGVVDLRSLGYYKIEQGILQQNLSRYYKFEKAEKLWEYFNKFVNMLKKERKQKLPEDKYPWLDPDDEQRYMTDKEILDKYINLDNSCLNKREKKQVTDMYRYKEAFSLR